jgi:hypothetical protein
MNCWEWNILGLVYEIEREKNLKKKNSEHRIWIECPCNVDTYLDWGDVNFEIPNSLNTAKNKWKKERETDITMVVRNFESDQFKTWISIILKMLFIWIGFYGIEWIVSIRRPRMISWKGCGRKQSLRVLKYYPRIYVECLEIHRTYIKDTEWSPGSHFNSGPPESQPSVPTAKEMIGMVVRYRTWELWIDADCEMTIIKTKIRRRPTYSECTWAYHET